MSPKRSVMQAAPIITINGTSHSIDDAYAQALEQLRLKNHSEAISILQSILSTAHNHPYSLNFLGALTFPDDPESAIECYRHAIKALPTFHEAYVNLGNALIRKGHIHEADSILTKAIELNPHNVAVNYNLTLIRKYKHVDHEDAIRIKKLLQTRQTPEEYLYFALGKIYGDCQQYEEEFSYYHQANQIINETVTFDGEALARSTSHLIDSFSSDFLKHYSVPASKSRAPLFIVGMPRTGTTLLASILSKHPAINTAGELGIIYQFTRNLPRLLGTDTPYPEAAHAMTASISSVLAQHYNVRLGRHSTPGATYIIDKHPLNFWHLGLIYMLFPLAKVIHCTRHPLDSCISNYFQRFSTEHDYSFDLENIGTYYREYQKIMAHWQQHLPMNILDVAYEDMVTNTEQTARKALDFLGLEWDDACLSPHTNDCQINTASIWQARQPIYHQSIGRWKHYEQHLEPLKKILSSR